MLLCFELILGCLLVVVLICSFQWLGWFLGFDGWVGFVFVVLGLVDLRCVVGVLRCCCGFNWCWFLLLVWLYEFDYLGFGLPWLVCLGWNCWVSCWNFCFGFERLQLWFVVSLRYVVLPCLRCLLFVFSWWLLVLWWDAFV